MSTLPFVPSSDHTEDRGRHRHALRCRWEAINGRIEEILLDSGAIEEHDTRARFDLARDWEFLNSQFERFLDAEGILPSLFWERCCRELCGWGEEALSTFAAASRGRGAP